MACSITGILPCPINHELRTFHTSSELANSICELCLAIWAKWLSGNLTLRLRSIDGINLYISKRLMFLPIHVRGPAPKVNVAPIICRRRAFQTSSNSFGACSHLSGMKPSTFSPKMDVSLYKTQGDVPTMVLEGRKTPFESLSPLAGTMRSSGNPTAGCRRSASLTTASR